MNTPNNKSDIFFGKTSNSILLLIICIILVCSTHIIGQHDTHNKPASHSAIGPRLTAIMGYSFIDNSFVPESNDLLIVPTLALNFDYYLSEKWGLGLHSDILLQQFKAETHNGQEEIVRENPIAICALGLFKPHESWAVLLGYGVEIEKHENLQLIRIGCEYGIPLPKHWEVALSLDFDYKINNYGALILGIGFGKGFRKKTN